MRSTSSFWFILFIGLLGFPGLGWGQSQPVTTATELLSVGKPIERELKGGEKHTYSLTLEKGTYLYLTVEQKGIDVEVSVFGPGETKLLKADSSPNTRSPEQVLFITEQSGSYRFEVQSATSPAPVGRYEIKLVESRAALPKDQETVAGFRAVEAGNRLQKQPSKANSQKALELFQSALTHFQSAGNQLEEALTLVKIGSVHADFGEDPKALEFYTQALPLFRAVGDRHGEADSLNNIGLSYAHTGKPQKALDFYAQALPIYRELGDEATEADVLSNIAVTYSRLGDNQKSLEYHNQALPLRRKVGDKNGEASTLTGMGASYSVLGDKQKALDYYNQALPLRREVGDRRGEGYTLYNMGAAYDAIDEKQKALDYYALALPLFRELGDRTGEAITYNNLGKVNSGLGRYQTALEFYTQTLNLRREAGDRTGEATALNNLGAVTSSLGELRKALEYYSQALPIRREVGDRSGEAATLSNMGVLYSKLGENQKALELFDKALPLRRAVSDRSGEATTLNNLGSAYTALAQPAKALEFYSQALLIRRAIGERNAEASTLNSMARTNLDLGQFTEAKSQIERALTLVEGVRASVGSQELRTSYVASVRGYFELYIDVLMRMHQQNPTAGFDKEAIQASERARARSLLDLLTESGTDIRKGVDPELLEQERRLNNQITAKFDALTRLLNKTHTDQQETEAKKEIEKLNDEYQQTKVRIRQKSPRYAALTQPVTLTLPEIQQQLDADSMLLEYSLGEDHSYLFAVTPDSLVGYTLPNRTEIEKVARRVYDLLTTRNRLVESNSKVTVNVSEADREYTEAATELSRMLLGPVSDRLEKKRLLIVANGVLQYLPFGALPVSGGQGSEASGQGEAKKTVEGKRVRTPRQQASTPPPFIPLLADHEIVNLPSVSTLAILRSEKGNRKAPPKLLAVLADPVFGGSDDVRLRTLTGKKTENTGDANLVASNQRTLTRWMGPENTSPKPNGGGTRGIFNIRRLPATRVEAEAIVGQANDPQSLKALDFEATRTLAISDELSQYRYVHFATHGWLDSDQPELSALVLSLVDKDGNPQNGFLRVFDVYNLNLPAEVVTLSACKTGLGKEFKGEGLVGMTRGFMYAGASRVVVSLWNIQDKSSAELMKRFYQGMLGPEKLRPAAALRAAQLEMWRQSRWQAPYYWAAFVLQGEPR